jgi:predicted ATPase with chaperone activity
MRLWGVADERLVEVRAVARSGERGIRVEGLPPRRTRSTEDRVRSALVNDGLVDEAPGVTVRLLPELLEGETGDLDVVIALAALTAGGIWQADVEWVLARGRLGLDGRIFVDTFPDRPRLSDVVEAVCRTPVLGFEHVFGEGAS